MYLFNTIEFVVILMYSSTYAESKIFRYQTLIISLTPRKVEKKMGIHSSFN